MSSFVWTTNLNQRKGVQEQSISWAMSVAIHSTTSQKPALRCGGWVTISNTCFPIKFGSKEEAHCLCWS